MKSFEGKKIKATPVKTSKSFLKSARSQIGKVSIKDGSEAFEKARELYQHIEECIEMSIQLQRLTR
jgi:hypothetical protein